MKKFPCGHNAGLFLAVSVFAAPLVVFSRFDYRTVLEGDSVCLLVKINLALCNHMAGGSVLIKYRIADLDFTHSRESGRGWNQRVERQLFALLFRYLNIGGIELSIAIWLQNAEKVADNLLLPVDQFKFLSRPSALGVAETLDEHHREVSGFFVVAAVFCLEFCGAVFLQFAHRTTSEK